MNIHRAKMIATNFSPNAAFRVEHHSHGLLVRHDRGTAYFVNESGFWPFVFRLAMMINQERAVAEIESRLMA